ncbi:radical SAM protein [Pseudoxanthomonas sp. SGD-10]|nr:radical SAM protein [Pseudoxanthomonas sp. SGD-10]
MIRISAVSYTNSLPFLFGLEHSEIKYKIDLSLDYPALCAQKLTSNQVDIGLIPVAVISDLPESYIVSDYCIGAKGKVNSVFIFSNCPIEEVEFLQLDPQSRSSNNLALVLLKNYWKLNPVCISNAEDYSESDHPKNAYVQIGDRTFGKIGKHPFTYDLAHVWEEYTGLPFVFAAWVSNKPIPQDFIDELNAAFSFGLDHRNKVLEKLPTLDNFDLNAYLYKDIDYVLSEDKRTALNLFLELKSKL